MSEENELSVKDRAAIVLQSMPDIELTDDQLCKLREVIYTLREAGEIEIDLEGAAIAFRAVRLVQLGLYTEEMKL